MQSVRARQVLLGFVNFYCLFIMNYAKVSMPNSDLIQKAENSGTSEHVKKEWTPDAEIAFRNVKNAFTNSPILRHFN